MLKIVREDISRMKADALVNCASSLPVVGPGVESALYVKGGRWLKEQRQKLGAIEHGHAKISPKGGSLKCKWVIHAVGPYWNGGKDGEVEALCNCYREVLTLAAQHKCRSLALPLISAGNHGFPSEIVLTAAVGEITRFLSLFKMDITLVVYDWAAFIASGKVFGDIDNLLGNDFDTEEAIAKSYVEAILPARRRSSEQIARMKQRKILSDWHAGHQRSFSKGEREKTIEEAKSRVRMESKGYAGELQRLLRVKKVATSKVYDGTYLSKQVFFKVYHGKYNDAPDMDTLLKIAWRLRLSCKETELFLAFAGRAFSPSNIRDQIIKAFISAGDYHEYDLDQSLYNEGHRQLFGMLGT